MSVQTFDTAYQIDHNAAALARLCQQFKGKPGIEALVSVFAQRYNTLEAVFWALLTQRTLDSAIGAQLDVIGNLVGQQRNGILDDDLYRRYIRARIVTNNSRGRIEDLIKVSRLVVNNTTVQIIVNLSGVASVVVRINLARLEWGVAAVLIDFLRHTVVGGDRPVLEFETWRAQKIIAGATAAWLDHVASAQSFVGDCAIEETLAQVGFWRVFGFAETQANTFPTATYANAKWGWYLTNNVYTDGYAPFESGVYQLPDIAGRKIGDIFRIERKGTTINYLLNGTIVYTSTIASTQPLYAVANIANLGQQFDNIRCYGSDGNRVYLDWQNIAYSELVPPQPNSTYAKRARFADAIVFNGSAFYPQTAADVRMALGGLGTWTGGAGWKFDALSGNISALFGSPALTAGGTVNYSNPGARGGTDKAVGYGAALTDAFAGGNNFDVNSTSDLAIAAVVYVRSYSGSRDFMNKTGAGVVGWALWFNSSTLTITLINGGNRWDATVASAPAAGWYALLAAYDRAAGALRVGFVSLSTGVVSVGSAQAPTAAINYSNASTFYIGSSQGGLQNWTGLGVETNLMVAAAYITTGSGVAAGLTTNLSAALTAFANYLNRLPTGYTTLPSYGNGTDDSSDKYPQSALAMQTIVKYCTWSAGWLFNIASGNDTGVFGGVTMTPVSTPIYGLNGPRGGNDKAIGFDSASDAFSAGNNLDISATDDLAIAMVCYIGAAVGDRDVLSKKNAANPGYYIYENNANSALTFTALSSGGTRFDASCTRIIGEWCVLMFTIDRGTSRMRAACRGLTSGTTNVGAETNIATLGTLSNAVNFLVGDGAGFITGLGANPNLKIAGLYAAKGTGAASGLSANLAAAIANLAAQINRYYGGPISAAME